MIVLASLALLSLLLNLWQWVVAARFPLRSPPTRALNPNLNLTPNLTLLKPLKGCDSQTLGCLESWFQQQYPAEIQFLFGVASAQDPVCGIVRELMTKYPGVPAELVICDPLLGPNAKVSTLCYLLRKARHEHLVLSDADVFIPPAFLERLVAHFSNAAVGLVNCFYELADPKTLAMKWEALAVNADFWSQVLQGISLKPMDFALGAVMATTQKEMQKIGGFEPLLSYLADDYELGHRIAANRSRLEICTIPVECRSDPMTWREVWKHQLRWARTIRVCQPLPYFFSVLGNATAWPLLWLCLDGSLLASAFFPLAAALRIVTAAHNYHRLAGKSRSPNPCWLAPVKDLLQVIIWAFSFLGNRVTWRGETFRVLPGGKLKPLSL